MEESKDKQHTEHRGNGKKKEDSPFDDTIGDEDEVISDFSLKVLGVIPLLADKDRTDELEKVVHIDPKSTASEAFRTIATSILSTPFDLPSKCLLVTSTQCCEGKTTISSNLALSLVQSGLKVVLVDTNLREPRLHRVFLNDDNTVGLSTYLSQKNKALTSVSRRTNTDGLDLIPAGPIPPNPVELFGSEKMKRLLNTLRKKYDYVILDGPSIIGADDLWPLSRLVDGILLVTSVRITRRQDLSTSIEEIINKQRKIIGAIVNRLEYEPVDHHSYDTHEEVNSEEISDSGTGTPPGELPPLEIHEKDPGSATLRTARRFVLPMLLGIAVMIVVNYFLINSNEKKGEFAEKKMDKGEHAGEPHFAPSREEAPFISGAEIEQKQSSISSDSSLTIKSESILARPAKQPRDVLAEAQAEKKPILEGKTKSSPPIAKEKPTTRSKQEINLGTLSTRKMETFRLAGEQEAKQAAEPETKEHKEPTIEDVYKLATEIYRTLK